jgi:hypothetical protein
MRLESCQKTKTLSHPKVKCIDDGLLIPNTRVSNSRVSNDMLRSRIKVGPVNYQSTKRVNKLGTVCGVRETPSNQPDPTVLSSEPRVLTVVMGSLLTNKIPTKM